MLVELSVENLALIQRARLELGPGYSVITGETGAGKSLLLDALKLVLGDRADTDLVRTGVASASAQAVFDLNTRPDLIAKCEALGLSLEEGLLYVQRDVAVEGRSACRIGGRLTPVGVLRQVGAWLVDLHGQHEHQSLLQTDHHSELFEAWIGEPARMSLSETRQTFQQMSETRAQLAKLTRNERDRIQRVDLLSFQLDEIDQARPQLGEIGELELLVQRQSHLQRLGALVAELQGMLSENEPSARDQLGMATKLLTEGTRLDRGLEESLELIRAATLNLDEGLRSLRTYADQLESDPATLETAADRLDLLRRLVRKYGDPLSGEEPLESVLRHRDQVEAELDLLTRSEARHAELELLLEQLDQAFASKCADLSELRHAKAAEFAAVVRAELAEMELGKARFEVLLKPIEPGERGAEATEFLFSANPGEELRPLAKIASGGELARVMLAIRAASAQAGGTPTLIFDEIETGLGGRIAAVVGQKIAQLAQSAQVITISHLPQVACCATSHYKIDKSESEGRVVTDVYSLTPGQREQEIARMLAGETITESALQNARELLGGDHAKLWHEASSRSDPSFVRGRGLQSARRGNRPRTSAHDR